MKIDRRSFLSFVIGGAAGTTLSPLPWKVLDDVSIWTQMWPWTPVPEDGEVSYVNSTCTLCPGGCGISVRLIDDRPVKIEGTEGHPVNDGGLCVLGLSGLQLLYAQSRKIYFKAKSMIDYSTVTIDSIHARNLTSGSVKSCMKK